MESPWTLLASIRFRLTVWYTLLLAGILAAIGLPLASLFEDQLATDRDRRLESTARQILADFEREVVPTFRPPGDLVDRTVLYWPRLDDYTINNLYVQVNNGQNVPVAASSNLNGVALPFPGWPPTSTEIELDEVEVGETTLRTIRVPIVENNTLVGALIVGESLAPFRQTLRDLRELLVVASLAGVSLAAVGGWLLAGRALRPIDRLTATAAGIAAAERTADSLSTRLDVPLAGDEVTRLATTFNAMLDRLQRAFATQRQFVADASHELRTPLTAIRGNVDVVLRQTTSGNDSGDLPPDVLDALEDIKRESERMARLLGDLLLLARTDDAGRSEALALAPIRLDEVARETVRVARGLATGQYLEVHAPVPVTIAADADRLRQLLLALLDNAIRHTPATGQVIGEVREEPPGNAVLRVRDTGEGVAPEDLPHVFDRFYRADGARARTTGGTGLGLAIAHAIAVAHGGGIAVESRLGAGSTFTVQLPTRLDHRPSTDGRVLPTMARTSGRS